MKVAILIPTVNRSEFIERSVAYYNSLNSPHPIYIGDASDLGRSSQTFNALKRFKNVEVNYFQWEGLGGSLTMQKLAEIAKLKYRFCAYSGDDDYLVPSSLTRCAEFLDENMDYRTAQGRAAVFELNQSGAYGDIRGLERYWGSNDLECDTGLERLEQFKRNYYVMQFSTHRIEEFLSDSKYFLKIKNGLIGELLHCLTFASQGKSKFIDCLYLIRSVHADRIHSDPENWIIQPTWSSDMEACINGLSLSLHEVDALPLGRAREIATEVFKDNLRVSLRLDQANVKASFFSLLKRLLPVRTKKIMRQLSTFIMDESDMRLLRSKRSCFYGDFLPVSNSIKKKLSSKGH